ncbi:HigA family addiction module antitoxin [Pseudomonas sp. PDM15]|uniref:HigA family addiction module antitoxin n=1 Tax=Pseudomonas sp. PDM15 TaxID=2769303 RepID=UPI001CE1AA78|nr:HigA family addiction module antitoxin [Pseudomonas sp. PDM15]
MRPVHPGEVLREEFLKPLRITPTALARSLHVSEPTIADILLEHCGMTAETAYDLDATSIRLRSSG